MIQRDTIQAAKLVASLDQVSRERFRGCADDEWLIHLGQQRRKCVEAKWQELQSKNLAIDQINATQFADKRQILLKSGLLNSSRTQVEKEFGAIEQLRNNLAHATDYALTLDRGQEAIATIKCARKWIEYLGTILDRRRDERPAPRISGTDRFIGH